MQATAFDDAGREREIEGLSRPASFDVALAPGNGRVPRAERMTACVWWSEMRVCIHIYIHTYKAYANPALEEYAHAGGGAEDTRDKKAPVRDC